MSTEPQLTDEEALKLAIAAIEKMPDAHRAESVGITYNGRHYVTDETLKATATLLGRALAARDAEVAALRGTVESERKACNHWFSEANRDHNNLIRADAEVARLTRRTEELEAALRDAHKFIVNEYAYGGSEALFHGEAFFPEARPIIDTIARALSGAAPTEGGTT